MKNKKIEELINLYKSGKLNVAEKEAAEQIKNDSNNYILFNILGAILTDQKKLNEANSSIESEEKQLEKGKKDLISLLQSDKNLIEMYDDKKVEYSGLAFAPVNRNCCGECYSSLPPQLIIDIEEQDKLVSCPSCSIFLYIEDENLAEEE